MLCLDDPEEELFDEFMISILWKMESSHYLYQMLVYE